MQDINPQPNYSGPTTTANSATEGRLKVGVASHNKKAVIKKLIKKKWQKLKKVS